MGVHVMKLDNRTKAAAFLGYPNKGKADKLLEADSRKTFISRCDIRLECSLECPI